MATFRQVFLNKVTKLVLKNQDKKMQEFFDAFQASPYKDLEKPNRGFTYKTVTCATSVPLVPVLLGDEILEYIPGLPAYIQLRDEWKTVEGYVLKWLSLCDTPDQALDWLPVEVFEGEPAPKADVDDSLPPKVLAQIKESTEYSTLVMLCFHSQIMEA